MTEIGALTVGTGPHEQHILAEVRAAGTGTVAEDPLTSEIGRKTVRVMTGDCADRRNTSVIGRTTGVIGRIKGVIGRVRGVIGRITAVMVTQVEMSPSRLHKVMFRAGFGCKN